MSNRERTDTLKRGPVLLFIEEQIRRRLAQKNADDLMRRIRLLRHWSWEIELVPRHRRLFYDRIAFAVLFTFFVSFSAARTFAYLVTFNHIPNIFLEIRGVHVHHFIYGIVVLSMSGFLSLLSFSPKNKLWLALMYGTGLGLAADEAGQWLQLQDDYWVRQSYDAIIVVSLILLFIIYLPRYLNLISRRGSGGKPGRHHQEHGTDFADTQDAQMP